MSQLSDGLPISIAPAPQAAAACLNCGTALAGEYCHACGQNSSFSRLDVRQLWSEFLQQALSLDRGLPLTVRELSTDPGGMLRRYMAGQRRRYASPVAYLLVGSALSLLALKLYEKRLHAWTQAAVADAMARYPDFMTPAQGAAYSEILLTLSKQVTVNTLSIAIPFALLLHRLFRRAELNMAEAGVFTFFTFGHAMLLHTLLLPLPLLGASERAWQLYVSLVPVALLVVICAYASYRLFDRRWSAPLKTTLALFVSWALSSLVIGLGIIAFVLVAR